MLGYPLRLRVFVGAVVHTFELEQYRCPGALSVAVRPGDVVIDGGSYCGDTALYFAHLVGRRGRVSCFEFEPQNLELLRHNLRLNPRLSRRIDVIESALWDRAGEHVPFREQGPGTVIDPSGEGRAKTDTIDELIERGVVGRVDFIKLDIEGAELNALRGAESALRRFRPRLAIAAYHRADDLATIPEYLPSSTSAIDFALAIRRCTPRKPSFSPAPTGVERRPGGRPGSGASFAASARATRRSRASPDIDPNV